MPNIVIWGGTYGNESYGQGPYGSRAFDPTAPSISNLTPVNGATGVNDTDPITFQLSSPSSLDPWSFSVTVGGISTIAAGDFLPTYGGSIIFDGTACTVNLSTHPSWSTGVNTLVISIVDLSGNSFTSTTTFAVVTSSVVNISDNVPVSDTLAVVHNTFPSVTETVGVTDTLSTHQTDHVSTSDSVSVVDALSSHQADHVPISDTVTVGPGTAALHHTMPVPLSDTVTVSDSVSSNNVFTVHANDTIGVSDSLARAYRARPPLNETVTLVEQLSPSQGRSSTFNDTIGVSDSTHLSINHRISVADTVPVTETSIVSVRVHENASDTLNISDALRGATSYVFHGFDTISVADAKTTSQTQSASVSDVVAFNESLRVVFDYILNRTETVSVSDVVNVEEDILSITSINTTLIVGLPTGLRIDGVSNPERYQITSLNGGVPSMVLAALPIQNTLGSGSNGTILGPGDLSNRFSVGSMSVAPGNYIIIAGRWQNVTARVISTPSLGVAVLDTHLMVSDPNNGHLPWTLLSAVDGIVLTIHEPSNAKTYNLAISELFRSDGGDFFITSAWTASVDPPVIVSARYFVENGDVLVTFSEELLNDNNLLDPNSYSVLGPTPVEVRGVRTASASQVVLLTSGFGTGLYTVDVNP